MEDGYFDINEQLSPTERKPSRSPAARTVEYHKTSKKELHVKDKKVLLPRPHAPLHMSYGAPKGWVGNFARQHDPNSKLCLCAKCHIQNFPDLEEGPTFGVHPNLTNSMERLIGLYEPTRPIRIQAICNECGEAIELMGPVAEDFDATKQEIYHDSCLSEEVRGKICGIGLSLPYIVLKKEVQGGVPTGEDTEDHYDDGGAPSGVDGGDEQAGDGAEQQHHRGVQSGHSNDKNSG